MSPSFGIKTDGFRRKRELGGAKNVCVANQPTDTKTVTQAQPSARGVLTHKYTTHPLNAPLEGDRKPRTPPPPLPPHLPPTDANHKNEHPEQHLYIYIGWGGSADPQSPVSPTPRTVNPNHPQRSTTQSDRTTTKHPPPPANYCKHPANSSKRIGPPIVRLPLRVVRCALQFGGNVAVVLHLAIVTYVTVEIHHRHLRRW